MSIDETNAAIETGRRCAAEAISAGSRLLAIGEMGIGNSTAASAICAAITGALPEDVCGRGTGCDDAGLARKGSAVGRALRLHGGFVSDPSSLLRRLGGLEIAAMCGVCIEGARSHVPVIMDGFISTAAAACAVRFDPAIAGYLIASHQSSEPGHLLLLRMLDARPLFDFALRLGEGTGAALAIPIVRAAIEAFRSMATFESAGVADASAAK
jgi:nicotinate-nucleotide--dimethylbenzimidazole phosphoribosyltransferase